MELRISDLLDDLQEVPIDILPYTAASEKRIKELTLTKIRDQGKQNAARRVRVISKVLIAAALITALTFSVMAATGTQFEDWIVGLEKPKTGEYTHYDSDLLLGATSYYWEVSNWMLLLTEADATENGITLEAMEYGNGMKHGTLTMDGTYWLESWNGSGYEILAVTIPAGEQVVIEPLGTYHWKVDWSGSCGALDAGSYRLGIPLTYTAEDGSKEDVSVYAKFRIFSKEMEGYIDQCNDALKARYEQEILHYQEIRYPTVPGLNYDYYTHETWKYGDDFLDVTSYFHKDGSLYNRGGHLLRDGRGYTLHWVDEECNTVAQWERAKYVEEDDVAYGFYLHGEVMMPVLGEIWDDGNRIYAVSYYDSEDESLLTVEERQQMEAHNPYWNYDYDEQVYTFDDSGNLIGYEHIMQLARSAEASERATTYKLEVFDTNPEEIRKAIDKHDVSKPGPLWWPEEQALYGEIAKTEGFRNTVARKITCADDAIDIAWDEADITEHPSYREGDVYNLAQACYDETADVWRVGLCYSQDDDKRLLVYLSGDGITLMTVYPPNA